VNRKLRLGVLLFLALLSVFDIVTTFRGTQTILGFSPYQTAFSGVFALIIGVTLVATSSVFHTAKYSHNIFFKLLPILWLVLFSYDVYTSYLGNLSFMYGNASIADITQEQLLILVPTTIFVSISSIIISYMTKD